MLTTFSQCDLALLNMVVCGGAGLVYGQVDSVLEPRVNRYGGWMGSKASLLSQD